MNAQAVAQVAKFLKVSPNQIKRCEEWSNVLFVVVFGSRPRFVSKKVSMMEKIEKIDSRIPKTLAEARALSGVRFHVWTEECRLLCQEYMNGECRADGIVFNPNPATPKIREFAEKNNDVRILPVIAEIAAKLK